MRLVLLGLVLAVSLPVVSFAETGTEGEYEIDYEEEAEAGVETAPAPKAPDRGEKSKKSAAGVQGSRAKDRFVPILKSETRSIYKKNGKNYDVDTD